MDCEQEKCTDYTPGMVGCACQGVITIMYIRIRVGVILTRMVAESILKDRIGLDLDCQKKRKIQYDKFCFPF